MTKKLIKVFIGLGTNQGNKIKNLESAKLHIINFPSTKIIKKSSIYRSVFYGHIKQSVFLNQVIELTTTLSPELFLKKCLETERRMGRKRTKKGASRNIDVDIIFYGEKTISKPLIKIPHHDWENRLFFVRPLVEINPSYIKNRPLEVEKNKIHKLT
jgi:2-amino-4-hydroxy-6-hydroxymethyldihydropteridine diphosphokinase